MPNFLGVRFYYDNSFLSSPVKLRNFELVQIGEMCLEAGFEVPTHKQPCYEISYIFSVLKSGIMLCGNAALPSSLILNPV